MFAEIVVCREWCLQRVLFAESVICRVCCLQIVLSAESVVCRNSCLPRVLFADARFGAQHVDEFHQDEKESGICWSVLC